MVPDFTRPPELPAMLTTLLLVLASSLCVQDPPALRGLDPVELGRGVEVAGAEKWEATHGRYRYRFASEANKDLFESDPERYGIQWGGGCGRMGPLSGEGSPQRFAVANGRVFIFASDGCRSGFLKDPEAHEWRDAPPPEATAEARDAGAALFARFASSIGSAERLAAFDRYSERLEYVARNGDAEVDRGDSIALRRSGEIHSSTWWGDSTWSFLATRDLTLATTSKAAVESLVASQRRELERATDHHLVAILFARERADFIAVDGGSETDGEDEIRLLIVHFDGQQSTLGLDPATSHPRFLRFHGRAGIGTCGEIVDRFSDWREVDGLTLPHRVERTAHGKPVDRGRFERAILAVDAAVDPGVFDAG
jgi:YHS domain-containing protein